MSTVRFLRENAKWLAAGALLSFLSSFGQTFFVSLFAGEIRYAFSLSLGDWGGIYAIGTAVSAALMVFVGPLADRLRIRSLGLLVVTGLSLACFAMALNPSGAVLVLVILALRFFGQGMLNHLSVVAMARWFVANRGKALAVGALGFSLGEAAMPIPMVWLKGFMDWRLIWVGAGLFCLTMLPVLAFLLRTERAPKSMSEDNSSPGMDGRHWTRGETMRHPLFWAMASATLMISAIGTLFWFHQVHFAEIKGWSHLALVSVFPLGTLALSLSTVGYGVAIDRFGVDRLLPLYLLPLCLAFVLHGLAPNVTWTAAGVILMGIAGGGQATLSAACWAVFFGTRHIGSIKSIALAFMVLGSALGPAISGILIDLGVSYEAQLMFYSALFAMLASFITYTVRIARKQLPGSS